MGESKDKSSNGTTYKFHGKCYKLKEGNVIDKAHFINQNYNNLRHKNTSVYLLDAYVRIEYREIFIDALDTQDAAITAVLTNPVNSSESSTTNQAATWKLPYISQPLLSSAPAIQYNEAL